MIGRLRKSLANWINKQSKMEDHTSIHQALLRIYEAPWEEQHHAKGVTTGIKKLDLMTGGFQGGEVTIVAGETFDGKKPM